MSCASSWNRKFNARNTGTANNGSASTGSASPFWPGTMSSEAMARSAQGWLHGPMGIAAMVLGFIVFWPIGLTILGLKIWQGRKLHWQESRWNSPSFSAPFGAWASHAPRNSAFDDWRQSEIDRIERERQKLAEAEREFVTFLDELKRAKDREEFDRFMQARQNWTNAGKKDQEQPKAEDKGA